MNELFLKIINMSISASWLVLAVLLLRLLFKKAPKWVNVLLWGIVAVRLVCPFSFESALSLIPSAETISPTIMMDQTPSVHTGIPVINSVINPVIGESFAPAPGASANPLQIWIPILGTIWIIGVAVLLLYTAVSYWRLRGKVSEAVILRDNIYQSENVGSPFVLGIIKPKVYLPYKMDEQDLGHVVAHEQAHIRRRDHWWKPLGFLLLTIHWFNPLMWLAYVLLCRDIELACDEKVIKELGNEQRADYTQALVACSVNRRMIAACPLAFGEVGVKERVKSVMNYRKPAFWIVLLAVITCMVVAVCFLTNPRNDDSDVLPLIHSHSYGVVEVTYETSGMSFSMVAQQNTPVYAITDSMQLMSKDEHSSDNEWIVLGTLEETKLTKETFDELFFSKGNWFGKETASTIRKNTANAWTLIYNQDVLYYVLQQKNGEVYLAYGYYDYSEKDDPDSDDTNIRWLFKLAYDLNEDTGIVATSGENVIPVVVFPVGTPLSDMKDSVQWLDIAPGPDDTVPFTILCDGKEQYGWYSIYDAETMESLDFMRPSGLSPQTYLFQNAKYGHDYIVTLHSEAGDLLCFGARIGDVVEPVSVVTKWFDYLVAPDEMKWDGSLEINLPEFSDVTFRWSYATMEAVVGNETTSLYTGMPIWNTYFCDLTGDGLPELCSTISWGSGMIDNRVIIYDYANGVSYSLEDRGVFDYTLWQNESDGQLYVDKSNHIGGDVVASGRLTFQDECIQMVVQSIPHDAILEIINPTDDPNFAYDTAVEKIYEDEVNEYFIGGLYSQHIIVRYTDGTQEDIKAALNSGRATLAALDKFGIRYWAEPKVDPLDAAISTAILEHYRSDKPDGLIHAESHVLLANEVVSGTPLFGADDHAEKVTAYILVHHVKYSTYGGALETVGGSYVPTAITFKISDSGEYILEEYWEPRDGSYYAKDIRDKFPGASADDALNDQAYIEDLKAQTYNKALAYLNNNISLDVRIAELLGTIQSSPAQSSNPGDYIRAHETEYNELLGYGEFTLRYCFSEFLQGGQMDLRGHIMALACEDIMLSWGEAYTIDGVPFTGQDRFDEFRRNAESLADQFSPEDLEKNFPGAFLLLQMSSDAFATKGSPN
jgi:beta-lactamase regulating signal transducer with metallopeptidase domain